MSDGGAARPTNETSSAPHVIGINGTSSKQLIFINFFGNHLRAAEVAEGTETFIRSGKRVFCFEVFYFWLRVRKLEPYECPRDLRRVVKKASAALAGRQFSKREIMSFQTGTCP